MKKDKRVKKIVKERNWIAVAAQFHSGSGVHKDKKKEKSKRACRGKVNLKKWG
jgi:hypothetical protein